MLTCVARASCSEVPWAHSADHSPFSSPRTADCCHCLAVVNEAVTHPASANCTSLGTRLVESLAEGATSSHVSLTSEKWVCPAHCT